MHYVVARVAGIVNADRAVTDLIGDIDQRAVLGYLADVLTWAGHHAGEAYVVLNAGRALEYLRHGKVVSKLDGSGTATVAGAAADVVERAVDVERSLVPDCKPTAPARRFLNEVRQVLSDRLSALGRVRCRGDDRSPDP